jgi:hypothetical protein
MIRNNRELTSLTLSCELGRDTIFQVNAVVYEISYNSCDAGATRSPLSKCGAGTVNQTVQGLSPQKHRS